MFPTWTQICIMMQTFWILPTPAFMVVRRIRCVGKMTTGGVVALSCEPWILVICNVAGLSVGDVPLGRLRRCGRNERRDNAAQEDDSQR